MKHIQHPSVLISALITEKSMDEVKRGKFTFAVASDANKATIKKAVEKQFAVNVVKVKTATMPEKKRRVVTRRGRREVALGSWKKAVVTLKVGQSIALFEPGEKKEG